MKKIFIAPIFLGLVWMASSCGHDDDWYYDDHYYDHHRCPLDDPYYDDHHHHDDHHYSEHDHNVYNYIRSGRWYLKSHSEHFHGSYESYVKFNDWEILHYDYDHHIYDKGTYDYHDGHIRIHYQNGDVVDLYVNKACDNELILRTKSGKEYHYVRG